LTWTGTPLSSFTRAGSTEHDRLRIKRTEA
jgi:hypothetical protein